MFHARALASLNEAICQNIQPRLGVVLSPQYAEVLQEEIDKIVMDWVDKYKTIWFFLDHHDISITVYCDRGLFELRKSSALKRFIQGDFR